MSGADIVILLVTFRNVLPLSVFADKHSKGTSPDKGLLIYFSASFHLELRVATPSVGIYSHEYTVLACNAFKAVVNEYVEGLISSLAVYPGEEAVLEMAMFDARSSLKLRRFEAENLLECVFSREIRALSAHSFKLKSVSSCRREVMWHCSMEPLVNMDDMFGLAPLYRTCCNLVCSLVGVLQNQQKMP